MKWGSGRRSDNVEDDRGSGGGLPLGGCVGRLGLGGFAAVVVNRLLLGNNPIEILGLCSQIRRRCGAWAAVSPWAGAAVRWAWAVAPPWS